MKVISWLKVIFIFEVTKFALNVKCAYDKSFEKIMFKGLLKIFEEGTTVKTLNIGTPRPATVVILTIKQCNFTMK